MGIQCLGLVGSLGVLAPCHVLSPETATRTIFVVCTVSETMQLSPPLLSPGAGDEITGQLNQQWAMLVSDCVAVVSAVCVVGSQ